MSDTLHEPELVIEIDGVIDPATAGAVCSRMGRVPRGVRVVLDVRRVRAFDACGLAALARCLVARGDVTFRGLSRQQERMLRYLGVDLEALEGGLGAAAADA